jgi:hypothetical protein
MAHWVWTPTPAGPLAAHMAGYEQWLRARGVGRDAIYTRAWQFRQLSLWLERNGLAAGS